MSRMFKRIASVALVLMMIVSLAPNITPEAQAAVLDSEIPTMYITDANGEITGEVENPDNANGVVTLYLDQTGNPTSHETGWVPNAYYEISGPGVMQICLMNAGYTTGTTDKALVWNLRQIKVTDGATLVIRLGTEFFGDETITINAMTANPVFVIEDGNLVFCWGDTSTLPSELSDYVFPASRFSGDVTLILDGQNKQTSSNQSLLRINSTSSADQHVFIQNVIFRNARHRAIRAYSDELANLYIKDCTFENTVVAETGGGGAIKLDARTDRSGVDSTTGRLCNVENFTAENSCFEGVCATGDGGAIESSARIENTYFVGCTFAGAYAKPLNEGGLARGGAVAFKGNMDSVRFESCIFMDCCAQDRGGAAYFGMHQDAAGSYSEFGAILFLGCSFLECSSQASSGGAIATQAQIGTLVIQDCDFELCYSEANGGAISLASKMLSVDDVTWQSGRTNKVYDWEGVPYTTVGDFCVESPVANGAEFKECVSGGNGGAIAIEANAYVDRASFLDVLMNSCTAVNNGSALFLSTAVVPSMILEDTVIAGDNLAGSENVELHYGAISSVSTATCSLTMNNCVLEYNSGCGLYWNANVIRPDYRGNNVIPDAFLNNCIIINSNMGIVSKPVDTAVCYGVVSVNQSSIEAPLDIYAADGRIALNPGTTFSGGISVEGTTLNGALSDFTAYYQNGQKVVVSDDTCFLDGDVKIEYGCSHRGSLSYLLFDELEHQWVCSICEESGMEQHSFINGTCKCGFCEEHSFESIVTDPTCTENGAVTDFCDLCGYSRTEILPAAGHSFDEGACTVCGEADPDYVAPVVTPTLTLKAPTLEFKDMITVNAMFTAENIDDVVEMGMITYTENVTEWSVETADHVIPGTTYDVNTGRYIAASQGIHAKYLGDAVYLACYARLTDGSYVYTKLASYSPVQYAASKLTGTDTALKQLVVAMLNYGAAAQTHFNHNVENLANASLTAEQLALPESYRSDMVSTVASPSAEKQGAFVNNSGFAKRYPSISFEGAFCINYFFTPSYAPVDGITLYYWNAADYEAVEVLSVENASGSTKLEGEGTSEYRGDITGIAAKALSEAVYVAAVYSDGATEWTSGVLGYSIGAYCASQATKGGTIADLTMATAVYGYQAKTYFG